MSTYSKITDDEMKYFQFKARQCFLLQKEDHEWNEFCKQKKCTCCSCQPICTPKSMKSVSIQASTKAPIYLSQNSNSKNIEEKELPKSLNDIKDKLEKIDFTLSTIKVNTPKDNMINNITSESKLMENDSTSNFYTEHKKSLIRKSLINSLQRLHSFANQMSPRPLSTTTVTKKHKSFFLPHDLQKQRIVARKAYLASLVNQPKIQEKKRTHALNIKKEVINKNNGEKQIHRNAHAKSNKNNKRQKSSVSKKKDETTLIQTEEVPEIKDENIETAVDNILEDLLSEEILALNRLRQRKMGKQINGEELKNVSIDAKEKTELKNGKKEIHFRLLSPESRNKIKQNPFFNLQRRNLKNLATSSNQDHLDKTNLTEDRAVHNNSESSNGENFSLFNSEEKEKIETKEVSASNEYRVIYLDPQLAKRISKQRYLYWQYLEKISRTKTNNFDPSALLNMVSESLLDDCILDVCQELGDMPSSLITDLYNQEFTPTI